MGFEGTDLASLAHLERPTVCHGHPVQILLLSISLEQAQIRLFVKVFCGERGIRTPETLLEFTRFPGVPLQPLEHLSSSQLACKKKLALRVWLAAIAPLNSGSRSPRYLFHDYRYTLTTIGLQEETRPASLACRHCSS